MSPLDRVVAGLMRERWAPLPTDGEFDGVAPIYWISTEGRVAWVTSDPRCPGRMRFGLKTPRPDIRPGRTPHLRVNLKVAGGQRTVGVHRLVGVTFRGCQRHEVVRHHDDVGTRNHVSNLTPGTHGENLADQYRNKRRTSATARRAALARWARHAARIAVPAEEPEAGTPEWDAWAGTT